VQATKAGTVKSRVVIIAQAMVRVPSREPSAKAVDAIRRPKPKRAVVATQVSHHIPSANRLPKASQHLDQVNHPMVQVAVNAVAEIALVVIDLAQTDAAIDKHFYLAHHFWVSSVRNPNLEKTT
jgi:hypothetical protein